LLIITASHYASKLNLIDRPTPRKRHVGNVPCVGGLAIYLAFLFAFLIDLADCKSHAVLLANMGFMALIGSLDDAKDLSPGKKLAAQIIAAISLFSIGDAGTIAFDNLSALGQFPLLINVGVTLLMALLIINSINMADGIDGLAGGLVTVILAWLGIGAALTGSSDILSIIIRLIVPVIVFLAFNLRGPWRNRASVFMGDAGTMMLGYAIAWFCLELTGRGISVLACGLVVALPVTDTINLSCRRAFAGKSPFIADRQHLHHLLEAAGVATEIVPLLLTAASAIVGGFGILGAYYHLDNSFFVVAWLLLIIGHIVLVSFLLHRAGAAPKGASPVGTAR
jgi:UDP-GlcNAc:undecaprenyl-phosphate/decaprenyl-phosphate GlcNAc-1-phosphate transferase